MSPHHRGGGSLVYNTIPIHPGGEKQFLSKFNKIILMHKLALLLFLALSTFFCNCKKETAAQVQTITDTVFVEVRDTVTIPSLISDTTTTFIIIRHAEKESTGSDPNLTVDGISRAEELKRILGNISINAVYSTTYNRTKQTVAPLATAKGITV
ncbi:partial 2,3-bisphosphoglycerate-dependent phosphoglycerate mutase, partial [Candidatus Brocadiaceae bacterium]